MSELLAVAVLLLTMSPSWANGAFTGESLNQPFTVPGRLSVYNGSVNLRIWVVGSKRLLYVGGESPALEKVNKMLGDGDEWLPQIRRYLVSSRLGAPAAVAEGDR